MERCQPLKVNNKVIYPKDSENKRKKEDFEIFKFIKQRNTREYTVHQKRVTKFK